MAVGAWQIFHKFKEYMADGTVDLDDDIFEITLDVDLDDDDFEIIVDDDLRDKFLREFVDSGSSVHPDAEGTISSFSSLR